jgi:hypothetical protein
MHGHAILKKTIIRHYVGEMKRKEQVPKHIAVDDKH